MGIKRSESFFNSHDFPFNGVFSDYGPDLCFVLMDVFIVITRKTFFNGHYFIQKSCFMGMILIFKCHNGHYFLQMFSMWCNCKLVMNLPN